MVSRLLEGGILFLCGRPPHFPLLTWISRDDRNQLCFIIQNSEILIANHYHLKQEFLPISIHGVSSINHLTVFGSWLFIWSVEMKSIVCISKKNNKWTIIETQKWQKSTQMISFHHPYMTVLRCLPALDGIFANNHSDFCFLTLTG